MKEPPRDKYPREALLYQVNKRSPPTAKPPRYWGRSSIYYIGKINCMYQYVFKGGNTECVKMMNLPEWVNGCSAVASHRERVVIVGGWNGDGDERALLLDMTDNTKVTQLPDLPEPRYDTGVVLSDNDVYVVGGGNNTSCCLSSIYYLSHGSDAWQTKKSMTATLQSPLVIQHQQCIYVLGGYNDNSEQFSVSQYNIKDDTWKQCNDMPVACSSDAAGVIVHEGRIKVITVDKCLMYADDTDTWTVTQYNRLGSHVNAFVRRGQICAAVWNGRTYTFSMMSYDDVDNVWKIEHERIDHAWCTSSFC